MKKRKSIIKILVIVLPIILVIAFIVMVLTHSETAPKIFSSFNTTFNTTKINVSKQENSKENKTQIDEKANGSTDKSTSETEEQPKTGLEFVVKALEQVVDTTLKEKEAEEQAIIEEENAAIEETEEVNPSNPESSDQTNPPIYWGWPSESTFITTYYGYDDWHGEYHNGIDIALSGCGSPIYAIEEGTVLETNSGCADISSGYGDYCGAGYGNYVWIEHPEGVYAIYAKMTSNVTVYPGQTVSKGQVIGYMGSSGSSSACHLHFGTFTGGTQYGTYGGGEAFDPLTLYP